MICGVIIDLEIKIRTILISNMVSAYFLRQCLQRPVGSKLSQVRRSSGLR